MRRLRVPRSVSPIGWRRTNAISRGGVKNFAARSGSELELLATIVYVDRELAGKPTSRPLRYLANCVRVVKPRFLETYVLEKYQEAQQMGLLSSVG